MNGKLEILCREIESIKSNMKTLELKKSVILNKKHSEYILEYICNIYIYTFHIIIPGTTKKYYIYIYIKYSQKVDR